MKEYVTSDLHFGHKNIIKYENRPLICREYDCFKFKNCLTSKNMIESARKEKYQLVNLRKELFGDEEK